MTTSAAFWDKIAQKYARRPVGDIESYEHTLARTQSYLTKRDCVLELGCGTGTTALKLAPHVDSYVATDFAEQMIAIGRRKQDTDAQAPKNLSFVQAATDTAPEGPFDAVLAFNLLHLVPDLPDALGQIKSRLKPGGLLISKTICLSDGKWFFRPMIWLMQVFGKAPFVGFLTTTELEEIVGDHGFEIVETGSFPAKPPARFIVARKL
jgi:ubiquinone/menaquinone biosynthesis C-methylase UbiE